MGTSNYLKFCYTCGENSIATKRYTRKDGKRMVMEYCINHNPDCRYRKSWEIGNEKENHSKEKKEAGRKEEQLVLGFDRIL